MMFSIEKLETKWASSLKKFKTETALDQLQGLVLSTDLVRGGILWVVYNNGTLKALVNGDVYKFSNENGSCKVEFFKGKGVTKIVYE